MSSQRNRSWLTRDTRYPSHRWLSPPTEKWLPRVGRTRPLNSGASPPEENSGPCKRTPTRYPPSPMLRTEEHWPPPALTRPLSYGTFLRAPSPRHYPTIAPSPAFVFLPTESSWRPLPEATPDS